MSSERRRSARLIESPWVYNWPKRPLVYITLDGDSAAPVHKRRNLETYIGEKQENKMHNGAVITGVNSSFKRASLVSRSPRGIGNLSLGTEETDDDDDFVTPAEHFGKTKTIGLQRQEKKSKNEEVDKISKKRNMTTEGTRNCEDDTVAEGSRRKYVDKGIGKKGKHISGVDGQKDNQKNLLNKLRVVYGHIILTWEQNSKMGYVMGGATYLDKGKKIAE